jgi:hypothetical protein
MGAPAAAGQREGGAGVTEGVGGGGHCEAAMPPLPLTRAGSARVATAAPPDDGAR